MRESLSGSGKGGEREPESVFGGAGGGGVLSPQEKYARFLELYPSNTSEPNQRFHKLVRLLLDLAEPGADSIEPQSKPLVVVKRRRKG